MFDILLYILIGISFGGLAAAGVLTVLVAVGLVPRFTGVMHEAKHIILIENVIVTGTLFGTVLNLYLFDGVFRMEGVVGILFQVLYGVSAGAFVGCLALAIAELLDAFPIFFRRISIKSGMRYIIFSISLGKMFGSFLYFYLKIYQTV